MFPKKRKKYFIGLSYDPEKNLAPKVCFKIHTNRSEILEYMLRSLNIPVIRDEGLAEVLSQLPAGREIPEELYITVAKIYSILYKNGYIKKESH